MGGNSIFKKFIAEDSIKPIPLSSFDTTSNWDIGEEVFAVGYPRTSTVSQYSQYKYSPFSYKIVKPTYTFGKIAMIHPYLNYFVCDLTVYPGNSGGPLIRGNKIIGLIDRQIPVPIDSFQVINGIQTFKASDNLYGRGALTIVVKVNKIYQLIKELQQRELGINKPQH